MQSEEHVHLEGLRLRAKVRRLAEASTAKPSFAAQCADRVAATVGSWPFVIVQSALLLAWIIWNATTGAPFDPYPFILLNLMLSFQAAYTAPIIMMSQNRQAEIDRQRAVADYDVNTKAELEIELLHKKIDLMKEQEIARLADAVDRLAHALEQRGR